MTDTLIPKEYVRTESRLEGIEVYMPASQPGKPSPDLVQFHCPQCGATTAYSPETQAVRCANCGYAGAIAGQAVGQRAEEAEFTVETLAASGKGWGLVRKELACQQCGALTSVPPESLADACPFCGSNRVTNQAGQTESIRPRYLIPLKVEPPACQQIARQWLSASWMTPPGLQDVARLAQFQAIYLPFWTFDALCQADWRAEVGHVVTERYFDNGEWKTRTRVDWRPEAGRVTLPVDDLITPGSPRLSRRLLDQVDNFDLSALREYEPGFLAGVHAQAYEIPLEQAWASGRAAMREAVRRACLDQTSTDQVRNFSLDLEFEDERWRYVLLPMYIAAYAYDGQSFQVLINGQTGAIAGQRPVAWPRVWLAVAALLVPGLVGSLAGLATMAIGGIGVAIGAVGFIVLLIGIGFAVWILQQAFALDDA